MEFKSSTKNCYIHEDTSEDRGVERKEKKYKEWKDEMELAAGIKSNREIDNIQDDMRYSVLPTYLRNQLLPSLKYKKGWERIFGKTNKYK